MSTELDAKTKLRREKGATTKTVHFSPVGKKWEALKSLLTQIGGVLPEDAIQLDDDFDPKDIQVKLEISCHKKALEKAGPLLDVLANSLRHVESDVVCIKFDDGTILRGEELKTKMQVRLDCSGNMPVANHVDAAIVGYLQDLLQSGTITLEE
jgi:hypothetical protein